MEAPHQHRADKDGPAWKHGRGDGWLLLRGPSSEYWNECWNECWERHLKAAGVAFFYKETLHKLDFDGRSIALARLALGRTGSRLSFAHSHTPLSDQRENPHDKGCAEALLQSAAMARAVATRVRPSTRLTASPRRN